MKSPGFFDVIITADDKGTLFNSYQHDSAPLKGTDDSILIDLLLSS